MIGLRHGVTAGGKEPGINGKTEVRRQLGDIDVKQVTENTRKLAVDPERDEKWVPMFDLF